MRTDELMARLRRHYIKPGPMPGGVFVAECGVNGAWGASSRCDALHVGFTSTSGRILTGHEVKVSRSDWLTELSKPGKADSWADQCHAWYLVTPDETIVQPGELPAGWGHMVPGKSKTRMKVLVPAKVHADRTPSWGAVRSIMARLDTLQRADLFAAQRDAQATVDARVAEELQRIRELDQHATMSTEDRQRLNHLQRLEDRLGVTVSWRDEDNTVQPEVLADAISLVRAGRDVRLPDWVARDLEQAAKAAARVAAVSRQWHDGTAFPAAGGGS